jgi:hypothetical protein
MKRHNVAIIGVVLCLAVGGTVIYLGLRPSKIVLPLKDLCAGESEVTGGSVTHTSCYSEPLSEVSRLLRNQLDSSWQDKSGKNPDIVLYEKNHPLFGPFYSIALRRKGAEWPFANPRSEGEYQTVLEQSTMNILP